MLRTMMKSKIHRATVTQADLHYVGSVTVDEDLLDAADLLPGELVHIVDITNGARLETYTIAGERGSGVIGINGAAARLVHPGDLVILIAYGQMETAEARELQPHVVFVDADNKILATGFDPAETVGDPALVRGDAVGPLACPDAVDALRRVSRRLPAPRARAGPPGRRRRHRLRHRRADRRAAAPRGQVDKVLVVTKDVLAAGSTQWAQGGIAAALGPGDTPEQHELDTLVAGAGRLRPRGGPGAGDRGPGRRARADRARHQLRPRPRRRALADPRGRPPPRPDRARRRRRHRRRDPAGADRRRRAGARDRGHPARARRRPAARRRTAASPGSPCT